MPTARRAASVRHRRDSCPSHNEVGGLFSDFEPFRVDAGFKSEDQIIREGCIKPKRMDLSRVKPKSLIQQKVRTPVPRLVIAKKYGYDQCGILMPNVYFDDLVAWGRASEPSLFTSGRKFARRATRAGVPGVSWLLVASLM